MPDPRYLDARMTGPDLQRELARRGLLISIVFITAHRDDTVRPRLIEQGGWNACSSRSTTPISKRQSIQQVGSPSGSPQFVTRKMKARSLPGLVNMGAKLDIAY